ncbi:hypothetical protein ACJRO7_019090, partial [Eucalyptus globulus]
IVLRELNFSNPIHRINLPVELLHGFDRGFIWNFAGGVDPKAAFMNDVLYSQSSLKRKRKRKGKGYSKLLQQDVNSTC